MTEDKIAKTARLRAFVVKNPVREQPPQPHALCAFISAPSAVKKIILTQFRPPTKTSTF
jgi:hypothetical protein